MIKKIKKMFLYFVSLLFLYFLFFNLPTGLLFHNAINGIYNINDCIKFKDKTPIEINDYFSKYSDYTRWQGGKFITNCNIKNGSLFIYNNLNIANKFRRNPYDFLQLEIDASTKNIFEIKTLDKQLSFLLKKDSSSYENLTLIEKKEKIEKYWPETIQNQLGITVNKILLEDWNFK